MKSLKKNITIILLSIITGVTSYYFIKGWFNIIPWATAVLLIGHFKSNRKEAIMSGAFFGYFLFLTYIIIGYKGNSDKLSIVKFIFFSILFSLLGSVAGIIGALIGNFIQTKITRPG